MKSATYSKMVQPKKNTYREGGRETGTDAWGGKEMKSKYSKSSFNVTNGFCNFK